MAEFGPTRKFPQGKIHKDDMGEIAFGLAIDREHGVVVLDFGTPVFSLGMPPELAETLGLKLIERARELRTMGPLPSKPS